MEIRNLNTFILVAETGSFTRAAEDLGYTQSTVSFQIRQLEEELNCVLFDRFSRNISLTEAGKQLLAHANKICHGVEELKESFSRKEEPEGIVRIVSADSICEKMMLLNYGNFYARYPKVKLEFSTAITDEMFKKLYHHEADVMFTLDNHVYREDFTIVHEAPVPLHFVASADFPLAGRKHLKIGELVNYPFLLTEWGMSYRKILDDQLAEMSLQIDPVLETTRTDIITSSLLNVPAISFLPDFVTEQRVREGELVYLDVDEFEPVIWKQLIHHKDKWLSSTMMAFLDFVVDHEFVW